MGILGKKTSFGTAALLFFFLFVSCSRQPVYPGAPQSGELNAVVIDAKALKDEEPVFYTFGHKGKKINFFVLRVNERIISFFDACIKCYPRRQGYRAETGYLVCRACNVRYPIGEIEKGLGSCYPIKLEGYTEGDKYIIPFPMLIKGEEWF
jgi:uncharacterized membrane protein